MRIYLVGFMGSGKSSLGQVAAETLDVPFYDTDRVLEAQTGLSISEIFNNHGETAFRQLESDLLRREGLEPVAILATGGGLPCYYDNMSWMNNHGVTIYLEWPDELITRRLLQLKEDRPLLAGLDDEAATSVIAPLLLQRKPIYEQAAILIEMTGVFEVDLARLIRACQYVW